MLISQIELVLVLEVCHKLKGRFQPVAGKKEITDIIRIQLTRILKVIAIHQFQMLSYFTLEVQIMFSR